MTSKLRSTRVLAVLAVLLAACPLSLGEDGDGGDVTTVWDLRDEHTIRAVGWPDDADDRSAFEARTSEGLEQILLPADVEVTGDFRAAVSREGGLAGQELGDQLRSLTVTFADEPIDDVVTRARSYAEPLGIDLAPVLEWAEVNRSGQATGPGDGLATTTSVDLDPSTTMSLSTRARPFGEGLMRLEIVFTDAARRPVHTHVPTRSGAMGWC